MKKLLLLLLLLIFLVPLTVHAQEDGTGSANIRRLQELIEEQLQEKTPTGQELIGILGSVLKVTSSTFTVVDSRGRERTVQVDYNTQFLSGKKEISLKDLSINSGVVVVGQAVDEVIVNSQRVLISESDFTETRRVFVGTITLWNKRNLTVTARGSGNSEAFSVNTRTAYQDSTGAKITTNDIQTEQSALIVALDDNGVRTVTTVRLLAPLER